MNMVGSQQMPEVSEDEEEVIWDSRRVLSLLKETPLS